MELLSRCRSILVHSDRSTSPDLYPSTPIPLSYNNPKFSFAMIGQCLTTSFTFSHSLKLCELYIDLNSLRLLSGADKALSVGKKQYKLPICVHRVIPRTWIGKVTIVFWLFLFLISKFLFLIVITNNTKAILPKQYYHNTTIFIYGTDKSDTTDCVSMLEHLF